METYDPNITRKHEQKVKLTLQCWEYSKDFEVEVNGSQRGEYALGGALMQIYEALPEERGIAVLLLTSADGDTLECHDEENQEEEWLKEMVVKFEILSAEPTTPQKEAKE